MKTPENTPERDSNKQWFSFESNMVNELLMAGLATILVTTLITACSPQAEKVDAPIYTNSKDQLFQQTNIEDFDLAGTKKLSLTIDDGPYPKVTPRILNLLKKLNIKATFFIVGDQARKYPDLVRRIRDEGHIVANHSYTHANLQLGLYNDSPDLLIEEVLKTHEAIAPYMSPAHKMYFRAPYAAWQKTNAKTLNNIKILREYIGPVKWTIGTKVTFDDKGKILTSGDWDCWSRNLDVRTCAKGYLRDVVKKNGGVILMHDLKPNSAEMAELLLPELIRRGYTFITLDDIRPLEKYQ